jgi:hypothetical protein
VQINGGERDQLLLPGSWGRGRSGAVAAARLPGQRDIGLRALEDNEQVNIAERLVPERIGPRGVREQGARTAGGIGIEKERNAVGGDVVDAADYEQAEGMRAY